jgi:hypothetical protein
MAVIQSSAHLGVCEPCVCAQVAVHIALAPTQRRHLHTAATDHTLHFLVHRECCSIKQHSSGPKSVLKMCNHEGSHNCSGGLAHKTQDWVLKLLLIQLPVR